MTTVLLVLAGLVLSADLTYDVRTHARLARWERETVRRHADGLRVGYEEQTLGSGRTALLMIHGFAAGPATYRRMAPALAAQGYTCRVMRLPGFGRPMADYAAATAADWRVAVSREVDDLRASHDRVWLVGHSMGATLAILEALNRPDRIDGIVLLAPLVAVSRARSPLLPARTWFAVADHLLVFTDVMQMAFPPDFRDPSMRPLAIRDEFVPRSIYRQMFALSEAVVGRQAGLRVPVLLVTAPSDPVTDPRAARRFVETCSAPRRGIVTQEHSGHVVPCDYGWEDAVARIREFVER